MGELADQLNAMRIRATVPEGVLSGELGAHGHILIAFVPRYYYQASERDLEVKLAVLGKLLWVARTREYNRVIRAAGGQLVSPERAIGRRDRRYFEDLDRTVAEGCSPDARIHISVLGMREWTVTIRPGTVRELTEDEFVERASHAGRALISDQFAKVRELRQQIYHPYHDSGER